MSRKANSEYWSADRELLAQLIEVTSIVASDRKLKKPIEVKRPKAVQQETKKSRGIQGHLAIARAWSNKGRVRVSNN